eukprot:CAMPEP_0172199308 /NCGR_PEP_ID=MMETSP1050-20130122/28611_1 /TAXON_ID=233186 /ORGANISM="Cryptomonas curvata, Strain CCAP979/52" /LENGTH=167 /DNA_ID=CAMNT_0012876307 /DNA_START=87 /DNA_END=588 /DNA_ORIENTATION=-
MWLLCNRECLKDKGTAMMTVGQILDDPDSYTLMATVFNELFEIARRVIRLHYPADAWGSCAVLDDCAAVMARLDAYSRNISHAIPSESLAKSELPFRNGWFLAHAPPHAQPQHARLLQEHGVQVEDGRGTWGVAQREEDGPRGMGDIRAMAGMIGVMSGMTQRVLLR